MSDSTAVLIVLILVGLKIFLKCVVVRRRIKAVDRRRLELGNLDEDIRVEQAQRYLLLKERYEED